MKGSFLFFELVTDFSRTFKIIVNVLERQVFIAPNP